MSDHEIVDGKIVPRQPGQFEFGERYVKCSSCGTMRPAKELIVYNGKPTCNDVRWCAHLVSAP